MIRRWLQEGKITELEAQVAQLNDFIDDLKDEHDRALAQLTAEHEAELERYRKHIEGLKKDLKKSDDTVIFYSNKCEALQEELDKVQTREKAADEQRKIVQEHLDVLSPKPKRNSKAKPPAQE